MSLLLHQNLRNGNVLVLFGNTSPFKMISIVAMNAENCSSLLLQPHLFGITLKTVTRPLQKILLFWLTQQLPLELREPNSCSPSSSSPITLLFVSLIVNLFELLSIIFNPSGKSVIEKKLSMVLTPALRAEIELQMKKCMSNINHFSISLDSWTSLANRAYLALTAHGISKNFEFESFLLDITVVKKSETGEYIAELVRDILESWSIDRDQVVAGTSDGASNCKKAIKRDLDLLWIYCLAHALN